MITCQEHSEKLRNAATVSRRLVNGLFLTALLMTLCAIPAMAGSAIPIINAPLVPGTKTPGAAAFTLTINGSGFVSGATAFWDGSARTTAFVSGSQLTASILSTDVATARTASVTVANPGGAVSNVANFQVVKGGFTAAFGKQDFATDAGPQDVAAADFNGDGKLDLALPTGNNTVSILLGTGTGSFATHVEYPVPAHPIAIITGDFNGDGKADLAMVAGFQSQVSVLLGNGDGTFQTHQEFATGSHPDALVTADVNGDGKLDIIVADLNQNQVSVLLGNGDGTFQPHVDYATGNRPSGVAIGDFNGDGKFDLAVANNGDATVAILLGNGDGTFQGPTPFPSAIGTNSVIAGDFNGDGKLDLAVGTSNKQVSILLGIGNGTFQNHKEYAIGANAVLVAAADLNSDGKLDLVSANFNDNTISTLVGVGDGTFKSQSIAPTNAGPVGLAVGDFNDNGKLDIAVAASTGNTVSVLTDSAITLSPTLLSFGTQTSGFASAAKNVTLRNTGTTAYTMGTISQVGNSFADFSLQSNTCPAAGANLAAGGTCTLSIVFDPTASEVANAQMLITSATGSVIGIQMTGTGNVTVTLAPRNMTFPTTLIGTSSAGKVSTFTNTSGVPITLTKVDEEGTNQDQYSVTTTCPLSPNTLAPGASCTSTLTFSPTQSGGATTSEVYYGNFTLLKQGLLASGQGTAVKVTPTSLAFPATTVGQSSAPMNVTFQNAGSTPMGISSVNFVNGTGACWSQTNTCNFPGGSVPANSSCTFSVVFTPQTTGVCTATMNIGDPDPTGPQKVTLTGTGQ